MRILLLSNLYPPDVQGGAELAARDVAEGLRALGHEVLVVTSVSDGVIVDETIERVLHYSPANSFDCGLAPWQQLRQLYHYYHHFHHAGNRRELQRALALFQPDVLYVWEITGLGVCSLLHLLQAVSVPVVFHLGSYWYHYARTARTAFSHGSLYACKRLLIGYVAPLTYTSMIAVSKSVKEQYIVHTGCDPGRIEVIYNGVHPLFLTRPMLQPNNDEERCAEQRTMRLLFVGRICVEKGLLVIFHALDILLNQQGRSNLHVHICGNGEIGFIKHIYALLESLHLTHVVTFHGNVPQDALIHYYDCADIVLVPSLWPEPFGLVVVEAMARNVPVIASQTGGPGEILMHGITGLLIEPGDEQALAASIALLWEQPELRGQLARAAYTAVHEHFTMPATVKAVEKHLLRSSMQSTTT